eukprot:682149-Rhodomonas_salina.1
MMRSGAKAIGDRRTRREARSKRGASNSSGRSCRGWRRERAGLQRALETVEVTDSSDGRGVPTVIGTLLYSIKLDNS